MDQVSAELQKLLRADLAPPRDLSECPVLLDFLRGELAGRLKKGEDPGAFALALVFEAALIDGPNGEPNQRNGGTPTLPLRAAKHLLALGEYPGNEHDVVPDTTMPLARIRRLGKGEPPAKPARPRGSRTIGLRARIAAVASGVGETRGVLEAGSTRLVEAATFLWKQIEELLQEKDLIATLRSRLEWIDEMRGEGAESETLPVFASLPNRPTVIAEAEIVARRRAIRRRLRRRTWSRALHWVRQGYRPILIPLTLLVIALAVAVPSVLSSIDSMSDIDPLDARAAGEGWDPGFGPTSDARLEQSPSGLLINRASDWPPQGSFVRVLDGETPVSGRIGPGEYTVTVDVHVREPRSADASTTAADELADATAWMGAIRVANETTGFSYAVFARISADDTATVWDGAGLTMLCDCKVSIEPGSARLYSDSYPDGKPVDDSVLTTGARIGYADDGVLHLGRDYDLRLTATLLIEERNWLPGDESG